MTDRQKAGVSHDGSVTCDSLWCFSRPLYGKVFLWNIAKREAGMSRVGAVRHSSSNSSTNHRRRLFQLLFRHILQAIRINIISMYYVAVCVLL